MRRIDRLIKDAEFLANSEGFTATIFMLARRAFGFRLKWRDCWIGVRYTSFEPWTCRVVTIQLIPCVAIQFHWRTEKVSL